MVPVLELAAAMVAAAPNLTQAEVMVLSAPRPAPTPGQVEFDAELVAAAAVPGQHEMLSPRIGQRLLIRARPEWLPDLQPGGRVRLHLEVTAPNAPVQVRPPPP
ncbi:MAG: hypothetical protein IT340_17095 [Chloroflexi bacterium]|nr:hypothetical protein [Chloroflexota bacterium]